MLARIWYEGEEYYAEGTTITDAIYVWNEYMREQQDYTEWVNPELVENLSDGPVIRKETVK